MSLQGRMKRVKRNGGREIIYNVYKFMKSESQVGITVLFQKCRRESLKQRVTKRSLCRLLKGENVESGVTMAFLTPRKLSPKVCTKSVLHNFNEAVLRRIVHKFYLTEKQRPTLKTIHSKMCELPGCGGVSPLQLVLRKMGFR